MKFSTLHSESHIYIVSTLCCKESISERAELGAEQKLMRFECRLAIAFKKSTDMHVIGYIGLRCKTQCK